jgi:23S rRNA pseudouridine2605 synthase
MLERLQKYLARAGVASRRRAEELIDAGRVTVNGVVVRKMGVKVDPAKDEVRLDTEVVRAAILSAGSGAPPSGRAIYLLLNKPVGFLSTVSDDRGRRTVMELLPRLRERVFPVGRLDEDSEGLLLLTNDGELTNLLTHPRYEVPKTYDLRVRGEVTPEDVEKVERGVWLSEGRTAPSHMRIRRRGREISHVELILREGRNREIRRIFARLKHPVLSLRRISLGPVELAGLRLGQVRRLAPDEVTALYRAARKGSASPSEPLRPHARRRAAGGTRGPRGHGGPRGGRGESRPPRPSNRGTPGGRRKGPPR